MKKSDDVSIKKVWKMITHMKMIDEDIWINVINVARQIMIEHLFSVYTKTALLVFDGGREKVWVIGKLESINDSTFVIYAKINFLIFVALFI